MKIRICLAAICILIFHGSATYSQTPKKNNRLGEWEYKQLQNPADEVLNHHADEGWEVVTAVGERVILKRNSAHRLFGTQTTDYPKPAPPPPNPKCKLTLAQAPDIRGLRLGMTSNELFAIFPANEQEEFNRAQQLKKAELPPNFGLTNFQIDLYRYATKDRFTGLSGLSFNLFDGKVVSISTSYSNAPQFDRKDQVMEIITRKFGLPETKDWADYSENSNPSTLSCDGFIFQVYASGGGLSIKLIDPTYEKTIEQRRRAHVAKQLSEFKP